MFVRFFIELRTPESINLRERKQKYPAAQAAAIGNPTSLIKLNTSIFPLPHIIYPAA